MRVCEGDADTFSRFGVSPFNVKREKRKTAKITTVDGVDDPRKTLTHAIRVSKRARESKTGEQILRHRGSA